jgi:spermidine synthase
VAAASGDPHELARQTKDPLLTIVRASPEFEPAYRPLLALAQDLSRTDPGVAGRLLAELDRATPGRDDARALCAALFDRPTQPEVCP